MKISLTLTIVALLSLSSVAQTPSSDTITPNTDGTNPELEQALIRIGNLENTLEKLTLRTYQLAESESTLRKSNSRLTASLNKSDSLELVKITNQIEVALEKGDLLSNKAIGTLEDLTRDRLFTDLIKANNPTSEEGGFRFTDVVLRNSETILSSSLSDAKTKKRWDLIVTKIVNNDFVKNILNTNPVTGLVSNLVSSASNFFSTELSGSRIRDIKDGFDQQKINEFIQKIQPYISYYENLNNITVTFQNERDLIEKQYEHLQLTAGNFQLELIQILDLNPASNQSLTAQADGILSVPNRADNSPDYRAVLEDEVVIKAYNHAQKFADLEVEVNGLIEDYSETLIKYLTNYQTQLKYSLREFSSDPGYKKRNANKLINDIEKYITEDIAKAKATDKKNLRD